MLSINSRHVGWSSQGEKSRKYDFLILIYYGHMNKYIFIPMRPRYVKKSEVPGFLVMQHKLWAIVGFAFASVFAMFDFFIVPKVAVLYRDFGQSLPLIFSYNSLILKLGMVISLMGAAYAFLDKSADSVTLKRVAKYKNDAMVNVNELTNFKLEIAIFVLMGVVLAGLILGLINPLYGLVDSL